MGQFGSKFLSHGSHHFSHEQKQKNNTNKKKVMIKFKNELLILLFIARKSHHPDTLKAHLPQLTQ